MQDLNKSIDKEGQLRKFDIGSINKQIDYHISTLKPEDHGAVIAVLDPDKTIHLAYVHRIKLKDNELDWSVMVTRPWEGGFEPTVKVRYTF